MGLYLFFTKFDQELHNSVPGELKKKRLIKISVRGEISKLWGPQINWSESQSHLPF